MIRKKLVAFLALLLAPPAMAQGDPQPAPAPARAPAPAPGGYDADPALWVVKDADTTMYLFGTIHVLKPGPTWFDEGVKAAFDKSDTVVLEMVEPDPLKMQQLINAKGIRQDGSSLYNTLSPADRAAYDQVLAGLGVPRAALDNEKTWLAATQLSLLPAIKAGYSGQYGPETVLTKAAAAAGKPVMGLETPEAQIGYLAGLTDDQALRLFKETLKDMPRASTMLDKMVADWAKGDPDAIAADMNDGMDSLPDIRKILLDDRNQRWAGQIKQRMAQPGIVFIAVGAGHLAGQGSLIEQLAALGLTAERVPY